MKAQPYVDPTCDICSTGVWTPYNDPIEYNFAGCQYWINVEYKVCQDIMELRISSITTNGTGCLAPADALFQEFIKRILFYSSQIFNIQTPNPFLIPYTIHFLNSSCWNWDVPTQSLQPCPGPCCMTEYSLLKEMNGTAVRVISSSPLIPPQLPECGGPSSPGCFTRCASNAIAENTIITLPNNSPCPELCYWTIWGNSNVTSSNYIGTNVNAPLNFRTNYIERMTINEQGQVGIGTALDFMGGASYIIGTLDINLNHNLEPHNFAPKISFSKTGQFGTFPQIRFYQGADQFMLLNTGQFNAYPWYIEESNIPNGPSGVLTFKSLYGTDGQTGYALSGTETNLINIMTLTRNGNVGIGYTNPGYKLNVDGTVGIGFPVPSAIDPTGQMLAVNGKVRIGTHEVPSGSQYFNTYKLSVDGTIICTELIVALPDCWADFVFKKDYKLPSLEEIEKSIKLNGTLPGIPSELDVKNKGVNVAEVQAKLLQKIEELTLYMIDMNKENKALKEKVEVMNNSIKQLKKSKKQ